jgi:hypothetical protein
VQRTEDVGQVGDVLWRARKLVEFLAWHVGRPSAHDALEYPEESEAYLGDITLSRGVHRGRFVDGLEDLLQASLVGLPWHGWGGSSWTLGTARVVVVVVENKEAKGGLVSKGSGSKLYLRAIAPPISFRLCVSLLLISS